VKTCFSFNFNRPQNKNLVVSSWAFTNSEITKVLIKPNEEIDFTSFHNCPNLKEVSFTDTSTEKFYTISNNAVFSNDLTKIYLYPPGIVTNEFIIPLGCTSISSKAFENSQINSVILNNDVTLIEEYAFVNSKITSLTIKNPSLEFKSSSFSGCNSLAKLVFGDDLASSLDFSLSFKYLCSTFTSLSEVEFKNNVKKIDRFTFSDCSNIKSLYIPASLKTIDYYAFYRAHSLVNVTIENGSMDIKSNAFSGCSSLINLTFGSDITTTTTSVSLYIRSIFPYIETVDLKSNVEEIASKTFERCSRLSYIKIPRSVKKIGHSAFARCSRLSSIDVDPNNNNFKSVDGVLFELTDIGLAYAYNLLAYPANKAGEYKVPDNVYEIIQNAFEGSKVTKLTLQSNIRSIHNNTFAHCTKLTSVSMTDSLTEIGDSAFYSCTSLASLRLPQFISVIRDNAFKHCTKLSSLNISGKTNPTCASTAFSECKLLTVAEVPDDYQGSAFCGVTVHRYSDSD